MWQRGAAAGRPRQSYPPGPSEKPGRLLCPPPGCSRCQGVPPAPGRALRGPASAQQGSTPALPRKTSAPYASPHMLVSLGHGLCPAVPHPASTIRPPGALRSGLVAGAGPEGGRCVPGPCPLTTGPGAGRALPPSPDRPRDLPSEPPLSRSPPRAVGAGSWPAPPSGHRVWLLEEKQPLTRGSLLSPELSHS